MSEARNGGGTGLGERKPPHGLRGDNDHRPGFYKLCLRGDVTSFDRTSWPHSTRRSRVQPRRRQAAKKNFGALFDYFGQPFDFL